MALSVAVTASQAGAAVTIGSNLGRAPTSILNPASTVTVAQAALPAGSQASGGVVSPVNGTVTHGTVRVGSQVSPFAFRVIRPLGGSVFTGAGTSATFYTGPNVTIGFDLQLPIKIGDLVGLDCCGGTPGGFFFFPGGPGSAMHQWLFPALADGGAGRAPSSTTATEVTINADIQPTSTFTLGKAKPNKKKGTATLTVDVPNPGELTGSGKGVKAASTGRAVISKSVAVGQAQLLIKAKGKKKRKLNETGKVTLKPKITYTPTGGGPSTQSVKVKLQKR